MRSLVAGIFHLVIQGLFAMAASAAVAAPVTDCPLAKVPYSSDTVLLDLRLDPAAKAVLDKEFPGLSKFPMAPLLAGTTPPTFAAILSPAKLAVLLPKGSLDRAQMDRDLAAIPITPEAVERRCARYDHERPVLPTVLPHPAILVFDKIVGFRDGPSVDAAAAALKAMAARRGWTLVFTDKAGVFNAEDLGRFDAVVWNNVSGDALTLPQRDAFRHWLEAGGGFAAFHGSAGDPVYLWDWYADSLIGARFVGHPMSPQFQAAKVVVDDPSAAVTEGLPPSWTLTEEWYSFAASPRLTGAHVLARLDEGTYSPIGMGGVDLRMGDHPIAWTRCLANGRAFYSAIGHRPESYSDAASLRLLEQGIAWSAGLGRSVCHGGAETPRPADAR